VTALAVIGRSAPCDPTRPTGAGDQGPTVTGTGPDAMPLATTTRVDGPVGIPLGSVNCTDEDCFGRTDIDVTAKVRA